MGEIRSQWRTQASGSEKKKRQRQDMQDRDRCYQVVIIGLKVDWMDEHKHQHSSFDDSKCSRNAEYAGSALFGGQLSSSTVGTILLRTLNALHASISG